MALSSEDCDNNSCGTEEKILFLAPIYAKFSPTDVEVLWFHPSWQLTQLLTHSLSIPEGLETLSSSSSSQHGGDQGRKD